MPKIKGSKNKKKAVETPKVDETVNTVPIPAKIQELPVRPTLRVSEVAAYYGVTERTVYLWIEHGHLKTVLTPAGQWRVTRESLDTCRFAKKAEKD